MTNHPKTGSFPITRSKSRLFDHLFPFFMLYDCVGISVHYIVKGKATGKLGDFGYALPNQFPLQVKHPTGGLLRAALENELIGTFFLDVEPKTEESTAKPGEYQTTALQRIITNTIAPIFTNYFENYRPWLDNNVSADTYQWPAIWNFARVVRNAASHGGKCTWLNANAPPVSWYHLTYSVKDRDRLILGGDLVLGDILLLMLEMDSELDPLGCQI